jgi:hypothetical protein
MISEGGGKSWRLPTWVKLSTDGVFSSGVLLGKWASAQPTPSARVPPTIHQSTRFRPRICFKGSQQYISWGLISPKPFIFGKSMGISSLNVLVRISGWKKRILTLYGSKCASRQDTQYASVKDRAWHHFRGKIYTFLQKQPSMGISSRTTLMIN